MKTIFNIKFFKYFRKMKLLRHYMVILLALALIAAVMTYSLITKTNLSSIENPKITIIFIIVDLILFLALAILVARKLFDLWHKSKNQSGRLQNKIILMFSLVAAVPTVIVTVFSTIFFNFGIQSWFDQRVSTALNESVVVAESYFREHINLIRSDVLIMAKDLHFLAHDPSYGPERLTNYLDKQADDKTLIEAVLFQTIPKKIIAQSRYNFSEPFSTLPKNALKEAIKNNIVVIKEDDDNKVRALIKLDFLPNCYLLVGRIVDTKVLNHMINTKGAASEYERLKNQISNLQIQFLAAFVIVSLLLLLVAIWLGLIFSSSIINSLNILVSATEQITEGNFAINVKVKNNNDEIAVLARAFNIMAQELTNQRQKLIEANYEIQAKHHFNETVLSGVSAGIIALDLNKHISMINPSALNLLSIDKEQDIVDQDLHKLCPEIATILSHAQDFAGHEVKKEIVITRGNRSSILIVRIITEKFLEKTEGYIVTFDDVTTLVLAQRSAAWSDVARKVAHEIKNPLTPIHLAAERLKKKYGKEVTDTKTFDKYLEIIIKHVKDIGTMVEEFVQFARMPAPSFAQNNLAQLVREAIFSRKCLDKNIQYHFTANVEPIIVNCDARQISQVLLNLLKNAEEAIEQGNDIIQGEIIVELQKQNDLIELTITDNGIGFSAELFDRLTEPYITSKSTGTGLGLAIVKKILDDHNIEISFANNDKQGAIIKLIFKGTKLS